MAGRLENEKELEPNIERWTKQATPHQVMRTLQSFGVPAGAVQNAEDIYYDLQLRSDGAVMEQELPRMGCVEFAAVPQSLSASRSDWGSTDLPTVILKPFLPPGID